MQNIRIPKISACMIVKNEEELLPNCLQSIKNAVDEIIVVDTGSTDNTITIAKNLGQRFTTTYGMTVSARQETIVYIMPREIGSFRLMQMKSWSRLISQNYNML